MTTAKNFLQHYYAGLTLCGYDKEEREYEWVGEKKEWDTYKNLTLTDSLSDDHSCDNQFEEGACSHFSHF